MATKKKKKATRTKTKAPSKGSKDVVIADFSDTESREGKRRKQYHFEEGDYYVECVKALRVKSPKKKTPGVEFTYKFLDGKYKGKSISDSCWLTEDSMWRFRNTLEAMGIKVPTKKAKVDLRKCKGKTLGISIEDDPWEDSEGNERESSTVVDTFLESELEDIEADADADLDDIDEDEDEDEEEDEEDEDEEDEEDEDEEDDELEDLDIDEL
jgi:hypothetical protein